MRNKTVGFPEMKANGEARAKAEFASKRADGTINTKPQQRMARSSHRIDDGKGEF
ncbi:small, acid-soluble spore protein K [Thalassobacillus hwangdonensis]|uniref:Small, acid-soluble spore protein K n=1 Tax=Thalassobacillus hwangdonensis TaxID=546108 RepID=A0ABW3L5Z9_9BACI